MSKREWSDTTEKVKTEVPDSSLPSSSPPVPKSKKRRKIDAEGNAVVANEYSIASSARSMFDNMELIGASAKDEKAPVLKPKVEDKDAERDLGEAAKTMFEMLKCMELVQKTKLFNCMAHATMEPHYWASNGDDDALVSEAGKKLIKLAATKPNIGVHSFAQHFAMCDASQSKELLVRCRLPYQCLIKITDSGSVAVLGAHNSSAALKQCNFVLDTFNRHAPAGIVFIWAHPPSLSVNKVYFCKMEVDLFKLAAANTKMVHYDPSTRKLAKFDFGSDVGNAELSHDGNIVAHARDENICDALCSRIISIAKEHRPLVSLCA